MTSPAGHEPDSRRRRIAVGSGGILLLLLALIGPAGAAQTPTELRFQAFAKNPDRHRATGCRRVAAPTPRRNPRFRAPERVVIPGEMLTAVVSTSCGSFEIRLAVARAPLTVNSFVFLAKGGFYDGLTFHRAAPGFVIQGGDPLGTGIGGPGYSVDEKPPPDLSYEKGMVAMAKNLAEPSGRSGSQFFVMLQSVPLPPKYALLGKVSRGMNVVKRIGRLGTPSEEPRQTVLIEKISIRRS